MGRLNCYNFKYIAMSRLAFLRGGGRIFASMGTTHIYSEPLLAVLMDLGRAFMNRVCARAREMLKPFGKKTNTAKRALRVLAVPLAACALMFGGQSVRLLGRERRQRQLEEHKQRQQE